MLVITQSGKIKHVLRIAQPLGRSSVIGKANDFIGVGNVHVVAVEGNPKREVQMIGKYFARLAGTGPFVFTQNNHLSGGGVGHKNISVRGYSQPSGLYETSGKDGDLESGRNFRLKVWRCGGHDGLIVNAQQSCENSRPPAADV